MARKLSGWKTKGMNKDLSVSAFNPEFAFENMNLRLSTNENNTLLSWVNEKGTSKIKLLGSNGEFSILGTPIGTAILNHKLVLFTHGELDYIYVLEYIDSSIPSMTVTELYIGDLNFDTEHPLETIVNYESEDIQKVYWVDGKNQPRFVNILEAYYTLVDDQVVYCPSFKFDFIPELQLQEEVTVTKLLTGSGAFAPGVIQYAFTYYNKYGQESNIFYTTPLYYISNFDRGVKPDGKVENAFLIKIELVDTNFDYIRIYSIQRTSINSTPICKRIQDIAIKDLTDRIASYVDTGLNGNSIDPTELLYKGGESIIASTLELKDNTLFFGGIKLVTRHKPENVIQLETKDGWTIIDSTRTFKATKVSDGIYTYSNQLTSFDSLNLEKSVPCGGFKRGDTYRCGVQFQDKTGRWSDPIWIADHTIENTKPSTDDGVNITVPTMEGSIGTSSYSELPSLYALGYRKVRAVVVFPELLDRNILCQGIADGTLFTDEHRGYQDGGNHDLYAQSSWFFRPTKSNDIKYVASNGAVFPSDEYLAGYSPLEYARREISSSDILGPYVPESEDHSIRKVEIQGDYETVNQFKIDRKTMLTLNSPEFEFSEEMQVLDFNKVGYKKVGDVTFGGTFSDINIQTETPTISGTGTGFIHKAFSDTLNHGIVSGLFYDDYIVDDYEDHFEKFDAKREGSPVKWMVYLWNKNGSLNNDINRPADKGVLTAKLKKKVISNLRFTTTSYDSYNDNSTSLKYNPQLFFSDEATVIKLNDKLYQGNIDTLLMPDRADGMYFAFGESDTDIPVRSEVNTAFTSDLWWKTFSVKPESVDDGYGIWKKKSTEWEHIYEITELIAGFPVTTGKYNVGKYYIDMVSKKEAVRMKYKSAAHLVMFSGTSTLDYFPSTLWKDMSLPIIEITKTPINRYGGDSIDAFRENNWVPCGEPVTIEEDQLVVKFKYDYGDTYFQRYDCLKTYPFTKEDLNQVVEIGSFMLETHVNIDGRYDRNRGLASNLNMSPLNFNLLNPVYSLVDNFFTYKVMPEDSYIDTYYPNLITWSKTKESGADVDLWTNVTLASILELDGDKGKINVLARYNDQLFAFLDSGISLILYNENVQVSTENSVPIEIANSGKVQGKRYYSNTIGCSNKWSMIQTPIGIYFMDSNDKSIYLFNGQLSNLSGSLGFNTWSKLSIPSSEVYWEPVRFNNFTSFYDKINLDVIFVNKNTALDYSEKLGTFTSFYDYGDSPFFETLDDTGIWIRKDGTLWRHQFGHYCNFFGQNKPYYTILVGNPEPQIDKIFTNLDFRACVDGDGKTSGGSGPHTISVFDYTFDFTFRSKGGGGEGSKFNPYLPFDYLETWNEYQHGIAYLKNKNGHSYFKHHTLDKEASLKRKYRIWRCDIPRSNADLSLDRGLNVFRVDVRSQDRMRNPWLYIKLMRNAATEGYLPRVEFHDTVMTYFG